MKHAYRFLLFAALFLLTVAPALAQGTSASLTGAVTTGGAPLPGVTVTVSSPQLQGTRTTVTGEAGGYHFPSLPPGDYTITYELAGMQTVTKKERLALAQSTRVDTDMKVSAVAEAITVTATAPAVLDAPVIAANVPQQLLNELPTGRTIAAAVALAPGVAPGVGGFTISGAASFENLYLINGVTVNENVRGQPHNLFIEDAIQETTILTGAISAEYGRFAGGVVSTLTKSGGNEFSGTYRDSLTNAKWQKKTPWPTESDHIDKTNQVHEGTLGGRIIRDRLWFFGAGRKAKTSSQAFTSLTNIPYTAGTDQKRFEGKLTGQITASHSIIGSYLKVDETQFNNRFLNIVDVESLVPERQLPNTFWTAHYNGVIGPSFFVEGAYSNKYFAFENSGARSRDLVRGTLIVDNVRGVRMASPTFCGVCDKEERNNRAFYAKGSWFLNTRSIGTHNITFGGEDFNERRYANNHQSGSDFRIFTGNASRIVGGNAYPVFNDRTEIVWTAIFDLARFSNTKTQSVYVNDRWDLNSRFSFNLGVRFDKNDAKDGNGNKISDDSAFSPRMAVHFDPLANGRHKVTASFARYTTHLSENQARSYQTTGSPSFIEFAYLGPPINTDPNKLVDKYTALQMLFDWFNSIGGTQAALKNPNIFIAGSVPGYDAILREKLVSPHADEWTIGYGTQFLRTAYARFDYVSRDYENYYGFQLDRSTGQITDPFGNVGDVGTVVNSDEIRRTYRALQLQAQWRPRRFHLGTAYTYGKSRGNTETETSGSGPVSIGSLSVYYPEYLNYEQRMPTGRLVNDLRHRLRLWAGYDIPIPQFLGSLNLSVLHSYNSGSPYSAAGSIDASGRNSSFRFANPPANPGYTLSQLGTSHTYFFSKRGEFETEAFQSTDLSVNYSYRIGAVTLFGKADVLNVFDRSAVLNPNTTVFTRRTSGTRGLRPFNPKTEKPIECPQGTAAAACTAMGAHWQKGNDFGKATGPGSYQDPREYRFALGLRF